MKWQNGYGDKYEIVNKVKRKKRTICRACKEENDGGTENPDYLVEIITNSGPTGKLMLCKPHSLELARMITKSAEEINSMFDS